MRPPQVTTRLCVLSDLLVFLLRICYPLRVNIDREFLKDALDRLTRHYEAADEARRAALREMVKAQAAIRAIYALATDEPLEFSGTLADACRQVYRTSTEPMTPVEARNAIVALGYNLTQHKNPLASIHSVLKRLAKSGDLKHVTASVTDDDGTTIDKAAYQWVQRAVPKRRRAASAVDPPLVSGIGGIDFSVLGKFSELNTAIAGFDNSCLEQMKFVDAEAQRLAGQIGDISKLVGPIGNISKLIVPIEDISKLFGPIGEATAAIAPHLGKEKMKK